MVDIKLLSLDKARELEVRESDSCIRCAASTVVVEHHFRDRLSVNPRFCVDNWRLTLYHTKQYDVSCESGVVSTLFELYECHLLWNKLPYWPRRGTVPSEKELNKPSEVIARRMGQGDVVWYQIENSDLFLPIRDGVLLPVPTILPPERFDKTLERWLWYHPDLALG